MKLRDKESLIACGAKYYEDIYDIDMIGIEIDKTYRFILSRNVNNYTRGISRDENIFVIYENIPQARYYFSLFINKIKERELVKHISNRNLLVKL